MILKNRGYRLIKRFLLPSIVTYPLEFFLLRGGSSAIEVESVDINFYKNKIDEFDFAELETKFDKPPRMTYCEYEDLRKTMSKRTIGNMIARELIEKAIENGNVEGIDADRLQKLRFEIQLRKKFKHLLRIKRSAGIFLCASLTNNELQKMFVASQLGIKTIPLTMGGVIGISLPAYYFFHMLQYYVPNNCKAPCELGKYTAGLAYMAITTAIDKISAPLEKKTTGFELPLDIPNTGGTIPKEVFSKEEISQILKRLKENE